MSNPLFDNSRLITASGQIDMVFVAASAKARAASLYGAGFTADDLAWWTEKLTGMAEMLQDQHRREENRQRIAVASLLGHCDAVCLTGALSEPAEQAMRVLIVATERAFGMPTKAERAAA